MIEMIDSFALKGAQRDAVVARGKDVVVTAGAGSGKTRTLVSRYMSLLDEGLQPRQIVAVTFTGKAAREMRNRIRSAVGEWRASGCRTSERVLWDEVEADIDAARIGTIHSLCASLIRAHPAEAGIDPLVSVLDEGLSAAIRAQVAEDTLGWATGETALKPIFNTFSLFELREILAKLLANRLEARAALESSDLPGRWQHAIAEAIEQFARHHEVASAITDLQRMQEEGQLDADAGDKLAAQVRALLTGWTTLEQALEAGDSIAAAQALHAVRRDHSALNIGRKTSLAKEAVRMLRSHYEREVEPWMGAPASPSPDPQVERWAAEYEFTLEEVDLGNLWADRYQKCLPRMAVFCKLPV